MEKDKEKEEVFDIVHKHPMKVKECKGKCVVCGEESKGREWYGCRECEEVSFCLKCRGRLEDKELKKLHQHRMMPKKRYTWSCDICKGEPFLEGVSMYCTEGCDFDVCVDCFWGLKKKEEEEHVY